MKAKTLPRNQINSLITHTDALNGFDYIGNIELINTTLLAIFSSAKCPASLILKAHDYAKEIRDVEMGIVSGFHSPAEREVLEVLLKGKCPIIVVLGRRLNGAQTPVAWKGETEKGRMLVISPFKEYQKYVTKEMSIKRNDLAARIAGRVMIVHASEGGSLGGQVERWKLERIKVEYLDRLKELYRLTENEIKIVE
jgi:predicted Rossmann fold nucleotide-binding protein DprA/Smf involved in DNA uptake